MWKTAGHLLNLLVYLFCRLINLPYFALRFKAGESIPLFLFFIDLEYFLPPGVNAS